MDMLTRWVTAAALPIALELAVEASAKTIVITDFATDPSGADYTISAVPASEGQATTSRVTPCCPSASRIP